MRWAERCEQHAHHLFMMRYDPTQFADFERKDFVEALNAEGINCSIGYPFPLYHQPPLNADHSRIMPYPVAEQACQEVIWISQNVLLAEPDEMDDIARAIVKVHESRIGVKN